MVENLSKYLSDDDRKKIEDMLHSNNIDRAFHETDPKASLFDAITIFFNEPLTKMIITGLLTSGAYDVIKFSVLCFLSKLKNIFLARKTIIELEKTQIRNLKDHEIYVIYNEFKKLFKSNIELKVIKIESGSFLDKLLGDKNIISLITEILHKCFDLVYKKYTFEGKLARKTDISKFIKEELDIIERCKSLGIKNSSDTKEVIDKTLVIVSEEVLKLASRSTKVRVNNEILKIEDVISEKYLLENKTVLIEVRQRK